MISGNSSVPAKNSIDLVLAVAKTCLLESHLQTWSEFMTSKESLFRKEGGGGESSEFVLGWSEVHEEFEALVERGIGERLLELGSSMDDFGSTIASLAGASTPDSSMSEEASQAQAFVEILVGMIEFRAFVDIMKDKAKRDYYFNILGMWRRQL
ncbi:hypothetical protein TrLO_g12988 [Triparma laevis f. longispina]|uniref:BART domain-containing protein n=1 Tax=Triparma laevis f. longispina TaxID=1714387 RepID=A0A9W7FI83_9STRA|nr:hypothetical protein TrLO_g12988 [Triparma laevis f. longispina]